MQNTIKAALAGLALLGLGSTAAHANLTILNQSGSPVWYTDYNGLGSIDWSGCLLNGASFTPPTGSLSDQSEGNINYVRGELKNTSDCKGSTLSDTGRGPPIEIGPHTTKVFLYYGNSLHVQ